MRSVAAFSPLLILTCMVIGCGETDPSDAPACPSCSIVLTRNVTLGNTHGDVGSEGSYLALASGAESEVFAMYNGNTQQIVVHGPDGSVERVIGGAGSGPGEFRRITAFFLSGDTLHVFDGPGGRISYMTPDGAYLGGRSLSVVPNRAVQVPGRRYIISANITSPNAVGYPLHTLSPYGGLERSFGADSAWYRPDQTHLLARVIAPAEDGSVWSASRNEYLIERWSPSGDRLQAIRKTVDWFPPSLRFPRVDPDTAPRADLGGIRQVGDKLWVLIRVPDDLWAEGLEGARSESGRRIYIIRDPDKVFDTVIEVLDRESGQTIASTRRDEAFGSFLADGRITRAVYDSAGRTHITLWTADLIQD